MKVVNKNDYQEIRTWIHRNARQLEPVSYTHLDVYKRQA